MHHITDTALSIPHRVYDLESASAHERSANASEKEARARVYAEVKRHLGARDVVICDAAAGNYIKGWRYQLFCEARAARTPCCVVHVGAPVEAARAVNAERLARRGRGEAEAQGEEPWEWPAWENLVFRYEEPNGMVRWDSPLFTVGWGDEAPDCEGIREVLLGGGTVRPNAATVAVRQVEEGYLYRLDKETQGVVAKIMEWTKDHEGEEGGVIDMEEEAAKKERLKGRKGKGDEGEEEEVGLELVLPQARLGVPVLQRLRRQYIQLQRLEPSAAGRIREGFVGFLNAAFEKM